MTEDEPEAIDAIQRRTHGWKLVVGGCLIPLLGWGGLLGAIVYFVLNREPPDIGP